MVMLKSDILTIEQMNNLCFLMKSTTIEIVHIMLKTQQWDAVVVAP